MGLERHKIERLAEKKDKVHKISVRDLAWIVAKRGNGATTVAATSFIASMYNIRVFATGGIGGVHRDGHITMDVSADLQEMSRNPIAVVCAGAKSILDIGRTLEYLETMGVAVIGLGTDHFPAFFTRSSGEPVPLRLETPEECAAMLDWNLKLETGRGMLISVPIPSEFEADGEVVEAATQQALREATEQKVTGRDITPFILKRVAELTKGDSLAASKYYSTQCWLTT